MKTHILMLILVMVVAFSWCEPRKTEIIQTQPEPELSDILPLISPSSSTIVEQKYYDEHIEPRYGFTDEDIYILAQLLCGDEGYDGDGEYDFVWGALHDEMNYYEMSKVLCVVMNRVRHDDFPNTVSEVIFERGQFADCRRVNTQPADIALEKVREWCEAYDRWDPGIQCIPEDHLYFEAGRDLTNITKEDWR